MGITKSWTQLSDSTTTFSSHFYIIKYSLKSLKNSVMTQCPLSEQATGRGNPEWWTRVTEVAEGAGEVLLKGRVMKLIVINHLLGSKRRNSKENGCQMR